VKEGIQINCVSSLEIPDYIVVGCGSKDCGVVFLKLFQKL
jgi:hypothetical protein